MNHDRLFQLMIDRLQRDDLEKESQADFIKEVVGSYMAELMTLGFIPFHQLNQIEEDLTEELLEMFRKKTYGSINLAAYKDRFREKKRTRRSLR